MGKSPVPISQIFCLTSTGRPMAGLGSSAELASITLSLARKARVPSDMVDGMCAALVQPYCVPVYIFFGMIWVSSESVWHDSHITFPSGFKTPPLSAVHANAATGERRPGLQTGVWLGSLCAPPT